ncbi:hypothetical protein SCHPADRAFT_1000939 [Schizopora paradoxa]|uniref:DUF6533 domain-containing protein n=1 Tax=Schizopora paradoxa TaxID=27342 RepID=A0A0H2R9D9_9AGAM|nr:hypothetical protein SCHPADRAFT_1000939 [Schizopora paradoxa]
MPSIRTLLTNLTFDLRAFNYVNVASATFLLYDIILTLDNLYVNFREIQFIWRSKWSLGKVCYILGRYGMLLYILGTLPFYFYPQPPVNSCRVSYYIIVWMSIFVTLPIQIILVLRTYALYSGNQFVKWFLVASLAVQLCCEVASFTLSTVSVKFGHAPIAGYSCLLTINALPKLAGILQYSTQAFFDALLFLLSVYKLLKLLLSGESRIAWILLKGSLIYFFLLIFGAVATVCLFASLPYVHQALRQVTASFMLAMASTIASRLVLNLRLYARSSRLDTETLITAGDLACISAHIDFAKSESHRAKRSGEVTNGWRWALALLYYEDHLN